MSFHDERDSFEQLKKDAEQDFRTPDSVRESAQCELARRGYSRKEIQDIGLGKNVEEKR